MSLDTLSQVTGIECCWIQTVEGTRRHRLSAERGLSREMKAELASMDMDQRFVEEVIGMGHRIVIPDLSADGAYGLESFRNAGFKWLIAVPLMTYRVHGILGIASRSKKLLKKETADLTMVIGGLIGTALNKSRLFQKSLKKDKTGQSQPKEALKPAEASEGVPVSEEAVKAMEKSEDVPETNIAAIPVPEEAVEAAEKSEEVPETNIAAIPAPEEVVEVMEKSEEVPETEIEPLPAPEEPASRQEEKPFDIHKRHMKKFRGSHPAD